MTQIFHNYGSNGAVVVDIAKVSKGSMGDDALILGCINALKDDYNKIYLLEYHDNIGRKLGDEIEYCTIKYMRIPIKTFLLFIKTEHIVIPLADQADGKYGNGIVIWNYLLGYYANKLNNSVVYCSFSYSKDATKCSKVILKKMDKFATIRTRENEASERLSHLVGISSLYYPDIAFYMPQEHSQLTKKITDKFPDNKKIIGINLNILPISDIHAYISTWAKVLEYLESQNYFLVFVAHDIRKPADDRIINQKTIIMSKIINYYVVDIDSSPEMKEIISHFDFMISGRMHAAIAALSTGVPVMLLDYNDKGRGLLNYFYEKYEGVISNGKVYDDRYIIEILSNLLQRIDALKYEVNQKKDKIVDLAKYQVK